MAFAGSPSVASRWCSDFPLKGGIEERRTAETAPFGDFAERSFRIREEDLGSFDMSAADLFLDGAIQCFSETPLEPLTSTTHGFCNHGHGQPSIAVVPNPGYRPRD